MNRFYTVEKNVQLLVAHLKAHNIKKIIASPGTQHMAFLGSVQFDSYFEIYSCVDERSAAYMAVGLASESNEPVVICCTGATASRNYLPALTEAYYRKLPVIAVTCTHEQYSIGHLVAQQIDRSQHPKDVVVHSELLERINEAREEWDVEIKINRSLRLLKKNGGGPIHFNLETRNNKDFTEKHLPTPKLIRFIDKNSEFPDLNDNKIIIYCGSHSRWSRELTQTVDKFCEKYDSVVLFDHTGNYTGNCGVLASLLGAQERYQSVAAEADVLIHIGEVSGAYDMNVLAASAKQVWRISEDGCPRDLFRHLTYVFDMSEIDFFEHYNALSVVRNKSTISFIQQCRDEYDSLLSLIPENLPFSNIWIAKNMAPKMPEGCVMHYAILNSLRSWNFFQLSKTISGSCNVGGFGIDGAVSTLIGSSFCNQDKIYYGVIGDLAFFYDMNAIGNRHVGNNVRILMINNGRGQEFRNHIHPAYAWGVYADEYVAAAGHNGNQSTELMKHMALDLGYEYMSASTKEEVLLHMKRFLLPEITERPMLFEVFTDTESETEALYIMKNLKHSRSKVAKKIIKDVLTNVVGEKMADSLKSVVKR